MTFSKAVFLTSLTCFSLGVSSGFACNAGVDLYTPSVSGSTGASACDLYCANQYTVHTIQGSATWNLIDYPNLYLARDGGCILDSVEMVSTYSGGTTLTSSVGSLQIFCVDVPGGSVTLGPAVSSCNPVSEPIAFFTGAGGGFITVAAGELTFGPNVVLPANTNDLEDILVGNSSFRIQKAGTIGSNVSLDAGGGLFIDVEDTVFFTQTIAFDGSTGASSTSITGLSTASVCAIDIPYTDWYIQGNLFMAAATLQLYSDNNASAAIILQGECTINAAASFTLTDNTEISFSNAANSNPNTLSADPGVTFTVESWLYNWGDLTVGTPNTDIEAGVVELTNPNNNNQIGNLFLVGGQLVIPRAGQINSGAWAYIYPGSLLVVDTVTLGYIGGVNGGGIAITPGDTFTLSHELQGSDLAISANGSTFANVTFSATAENYSGNLTLNNVRFTNVGTYLDSTKFVLNNASILTVDVGTVVSGISVSDGSSIVLNSSLTVNLVEDTTFGEISGAGNLVLSGAYVATLTGANTYSGGTALENGVDLQISSGSNLGTGNISMWDGTVLELTSDLTLSNDIILGGGAGDVGLINLNDSVQATFSGIISNPATLYVIGNSTAPGTLTLSGAFANTYSGATIVENAILSISDVTYLGSDRNMTLDGGTLTYTGTVDLSLAALQLDSLGGELQINSDSVTLTIPGEISGTGDLTLSGSGVFVLSGASTYTGNTVFTAKELQIAADNNLGASTNIFTISGSSSQLTMTNALSMTREVSLQTVGVTLSVSNAGTTASLTGPLTLSDNFSILTTSGSGILSLLPTSATLPSSPFTLSIQGGGVISNTTFLATSVVELSSGGLTFSESGIGSYVGSSDGTISGSFGVTIDGGTLEMLIPKSTSATQFINTYVGPTTLVTGTLAISADVVDGQTEGAVLGSIVSGATSTLAFSGGTLQTVLVDETVSTVVSVTRPVSFASDTNSTINTLAYTDSGTTTYTTLVLNGAVSGTGNFTKSGNGILIITADDDLYEGTMKITAGSIEATLESNFSKSNIEVKGVKEEIKQLAEDLDDLLTAIIYAAEYRSGGKSKSVKAFNRYSKVRGGNSIGTLTVLEDLIFEGESSLFTEFNSLEEASLVDVGGDVVIAPRASLLTVPQPGAYSDSLSFTAVQADGEIIGEFGKHFAPPVFYMAVDGEYTGGSIVLTVTPHTITLTGAGNNANAVANTLNDVIVWNRANVDLTVSAVDITEKGRLGKVFESLLPIHGTSAMNTALDQLHPVALKGVVVAQENASVQVQETLSTRLNEEMETLDCARTKHAYTFWINGMASATNQDNNTFKGSPQVGYNNTMAGFTAGVDYRFIDILYVGALGGYTSSHVKFQKNRGTGDVHTGYFGLYASAIGEGYFANVSVTGGWNGYSANRHIEYSGTNVTAKNSHGGRQLMSHAEGGLNLPLGKFNLRPFDRFDYLSQQEYGYKEKDAGDWNLSVNKNTSILLRNELGLQFASCFQVKTGKLTVSPKVSWVREVRTRGSKYTAAFTDAEDFTFSVTGYFPNRSLFSTGGVITGALLDDKLSLSAYYDGEFTSGYSAHRYGGEVRVSF